MSADKTVGDEQKSGRRRSLLGRNRPEEIEEEEVVEERGVTTGKGRATPGRRQQDEEEDTGNVATRTVGGVREYLEGVRSELSKVIWPTREEAQRLTIIVIVTLIASAAVLGAISLFFTELFRIGLGSPIILIAVMVIAVAGGLIFMRVNSRRSSY
ncbi:MAG: preprotein translocase subunit SecE [Chloroflexi bacterium]|nr:preprotein translocase subunit SecE [Chloroflexota bacterium]